MLWLLPLLSLTQEQNQCDATVLTIARSCYHRSGWSMYQCMWVILITCFIWALTPSVEDSSLYFVVGNCIFCIES